MSIFDLVPTPSLQDASHVLCIQPHPDDMDVACGGTLAVLAMDGVTITYLTVTDGGAGTMERCDETELSQLRQNEQRLAGACIGVSDYRWLNYRDADPIPESKLQADLIRAIRELRPDTVLTLDPWLPYEAHPAHRSVGLCAAAAVLFAGMGNVSPELTDSGILPHQVTRIAFGLTAHPNTRQDVTAVWNRKLQAIRTHKSQFPEDTWSFYGAYFAEKASQLGAQAGCQYAEALKVLTPMHLHCNVDASLL